MLFRECGRHWPCSGAITYAVVAVVLDVVFGGVIRMTCRKLCVTVRDERLMRGVRVVAFLIVL